MKKGAKIAIAISGTLVIALAVGGTIFYVNKNKYNPEKVLEEYTSLINDKKYEEMYSKTTKGSQGNISKEDFIKRNKPHQMIRLLVTFLFKAFLNLSSLTYSVTEIVELSSSNLT